MWVYLNSTSFLMRVNGKEMQAAFLSLCLHTFYLTAREVAVMATHCLVTMPMVMVGMVIVMAT